MRLTVGPLPAAVYWRRRAVVVVGFVIVALIVFYSCGEALSSNAGAQPTVTPNAPTAPVTTTTQPRPTTTTQTPTATAFTLTTTTSTANGPCTDAELKVTVKASAAQVSAGSTVVFTITLTNTSARTCSRDIGADLQELRLLDGDAIVWSSDDCDPNTGRDVRSFGPGQSVSFSPSWDGQRSRTSTNIKVCTGDRPLELKEYQLVGRLDQILSEPFALRIRA